MRKATTALPVELRQMVRATLALLGEVIRTELGEKRFQEIESIRRRMALLRKASPSETDAVLHQTFQFLREKSPEDQSSIARAFALMLELMNACENAYRTYRLRSRLIGSHSKGAHSKRDQEPSSRVPQRIIYVLTAHPTESRAPQNVLIFQWIRATLTEAFETTFNAESRTLFHLIGMAWRVPIVRNNAPTVSDEAEHIYSLVMREEILDALTQSEIPVYLRSWVGGDKDGHPGVDENTLLQSLNLSRGRLIAYLKNKFSHMEEALALLNPGESEAELKALCADTKNSLTDFSQIRVGDGLRVRSFHRRAEVLSQAYLRILHSTPPVLDQVNGLLKLFPGLVVPLELRESTDVISKSKNRKELAIYRMLQTVGSISNGGDPRWYACELILSMTRSAQQLQDAAELVKETLGAVQLPIVPLFEQVRDLHESYEITSQFLKSPLIHQTLNQYWNRSLEVMVGYSDSAKEGGMLPSRLAISQAMSELESGLARKNEENLELVFFHGSGGSVDRGGGSLEEQIRGWPASALRIYKSTIQGEMVDRLFSSREILFGQVHRFSEEAEQMIKKIGRKKKKGSCIQHSPVLLEFTSYVEKEYRRKTTSPEFLKLIEQATPYRFLSVLKMGSRPTARQSGTVSLQSLRAIPWVLCWTQTRVLFPTWWGIGTAWNHLTPAKKRALKKAFQNDPLFQSFVKLLGFTLAKIELPVWKFYLQPPSMTTQEMERALREFQEELEAALDFVRFMSGSKNFLWYRPWLETSIRLRSPMIHPLNLLQVIAFERQDPALIRLTVTGIASGMMTTG